MENIREVRGVMYGEATAEELVEMHQQLLREIAPLCIHKPAAVVAAVLVKLLVKAVSMGGEQYHAVAKDEDLMHEARTSVSHFVLTEMDRVAKKHAERN